ncbi:hypothetical protein HMPREF0083_00800 [Aneurinibacillus aneurinilyticus ATCC 12856]|uniref:Uncharacterized protein n=1 Tax=Aneurinibacillus aneurinilyticus ATCC 12856 TaxID=649747 RepID=U1YG85_ANEAE|nr:hypothetical protein HMPREF0083_00800 [Aneurinibacillus aneurinilyticus ATCC 12856]
MGNYADRIVWSERRDVIMMNMKIAEIVEVKVTGILPSVGR